MNSPKNAFFLMLGVIALAIGLGTAGYYFGNSTLETKAQSLSDTKADQELIQEKIKTYEDSKSKVNQFSFVEDLANQILPQTKNQSEAIAEINKFAKETGISISAITFQGGESGGSKNPEVSQTSKLKGLTGVRVLTAGVSVRQGASYDEFLDFLEKIETNQRKMRVVDISVGVSPQDRDVLSSASLTINIFLKG